MKKRAIFEREASTEQEDPTNSRASALAAANRRSGEFSSTFKSRLSTFESAETASSSGVTSAQPAASKVTPDPQFKTKLATFHRTASADEVKKTTPVVVTTDVEEKPDFKARLAAFRQVEETMKATPEPVKPAPKPKPPGLRQEQHKPIVPVTKQQPEPDKNATQVIHSYFFNKLCIAWFVLAAGARITGTGAGRRANLCEFIGGFEPSVP